MNQVGHKNEAERLLALADVAKFSLDAAYYNSAALAHAVLAQASWPDQHRPDASPRADMSPPEGEGWEHRYSTRCPRMGEHYPDPHYAHLQPRLPVPCSECYSIEEWFRKVSWRPDTEPVPE